MQLKTFTALITVAVEDSQEMPHELVMSERIAVALEGRKPMAYPPVQACHASIVQGDVLMDPFVSLRTTQNGGLLTLNALGHTLKLIKDQHGLLHRRATEPNSIPHLGSDEGDCAN